MSHSVVIIDDDGITLDLMVSIVEDELDAIVYSFTDAQMAKNFLKGEHASRLDLIITDYQMPGCSGIDLMQFIKQSRLKTPILMVSAQGTKETVVKAVKNGASGFIVKPFQKNELVTKAQSLLN